MMSMNSNKMKEKDYYNESEDENKNIDLSQKITALRLIATDFERRITGSRQYGSGGNWEYTGNVLAGQETASKLTGFLQSFCNEINLISENKDYTLAWEKFHNIDAMLDSTLLDPNLEDHYNTVIVLFWNALTRILRIIGTSKGLFEKYFTNPELDTLEKKEGVV